MYFSKENRFGTWNGILFVVLFAIAGAFVSNLSWFRELKLSPLMIALCLGILYGNTLGHKLPIKWSPGVRFAARYALQLGIVLYGFRITFQDVYHVGLAGLFLDLFTIITVLLLSLWLGTRFFKIDRDIALLIGTGFGICGAAAVLATEGVLKSEPYKATTALATVVLFGTIALFLYPFLQAHFFHFTDAQFGIYTGSTVHEVAQVIAIGNMVSPDAEATALIVKMTRVMLLAPVLLIVGIFTGKRGGSSKTRMIPWFAVGFILIAGVNSLQLLSEKTVFLITRFDTFLLTMAMAAIGIETNFKKIMQTGFKPLYLAAILFLWLLFSGGVLSSWVKTQQII